ncbi:MAG TPA: hypothetical protein VEX62_11765 [Candidatus Limnocylindrales bacterium]|nr:hypothetical protein [Candidatus Limnocylindrales bacterium]
MTLLRFLMLALAIAAGAVVLYGLFIESSSIKLALIVSGLAVLAVCLGVLGFGMAGSSVRLGRGGRLGWAMLIAFVGGLFVLGAAGSLAAAIVLGLLAAA